MFGWFKRNEPEVCSVLPTSLQPEPKVEFGWGVACDDHHTRGYNTSEITTEFLRKGSVYICSECGKRMKPAVIKAVHEYRWMETMVYRGRFGDDPKYVWKWVASDGKFTFHRFLTV